MRFEKCEYVVTIPFHELMNIHHYQIRGIVARDTRFVYKEIVIAVFFLVSSSIFFRLMLRAAL